jgi:hypothetical protein
VSDSIDDIFNSIVKDTELFVTSTKETFLHNSSKAIAERFAHEIINLLTSKSLSPPLSDKTIERRRRRGNDVLGSDYPMLETGEWIKYIEFRINEFANHDEIEIGVYDTSTRIGHSSSRTPAFIAEINEYGMEDIHIPARGLFTTTEIRVISQLDSIINEAWDNIKEVDIPVTVSTNNLVGNIEFNGSEYKFRWNE